MPDMEIGLALPQYDYSVPGQDPLNYPVILQHAQQARMLGVTSLWLSDHIVLDLVKYGGEPRDYGAFEPLTTLVALSQMVPDVRLGTLVLCEGIRSIPLLAKTASSADAVMGGRLELGIGAGWYEPDYSMVGLEMPPVGERMARLKESLQALRTLFGPGPVDFKGRFTNFTGAYTLPASPQIGGPPLWVGGKGDRLLGIVAAGADGWNTCWVWTHEAYDARRAVLDAHCDRINRDPASIRRSVGLYALVGENESDLASRFERLKQNTPRGVMSGVSLEDWRQGRLVGTVEEVRDQLGRWGELGIESVIVGLGAVPFQVGSLDDLDPIMAAAST